MPDTPDWTMKQDDCCGYWNNPPTRMKMCGGCDSCEGYGDYLHEQRKDRMLDEVGYD